MKLCLKTLQCVLIFQWNGLFRLKLYPKITLLLNILPPPLNLINSTKQIYFQKVTA